MKWGVVSNLIQLSISVQNPSLAAVVYNKTHSLPSLLAEKATWHVLHQSFFQIDSRPIASSHVKPKLHNCPWVAWHSRGWLYAPCHDNTGLKSSDVCMFVCFLMRQTWAHPEDTTCRSKQRSLFTLELHNKHSLMAGWKMFTISNLTNTFYVAREKPFLLKFIWIDRQLILHSSTLIIKKYDINLLICSQQQICRKVTSTAKDVEPSVCLDKESASHVVSIQ